VKLVTSIAVIVSGTSITWNESPTTDSRIANMSSLSTCGWEFVDYKSVVCSVTRAEINSHPIRRLLSRDLENNATDQMKMICRVSAFWTQWVTERWRRSGRPMKGQLIDARQARSPRQVPVPVGVRARSRPTLTLPRDTNSLVGWLSRNQPRRLASTVTHFWCQKGFVFC